MNNIIKNQWVNALRSKQYNQARAYLKTSEGYCCLGVLCSLYMQQNPGKAEWVPALSGDKDGYHLRTTADGLVHDTNTLPEIVLKWSGLDEEDPRFVLPKHQKQLDAGVSYLDEHNLAHVNDEGETFQNIADRIEFGTEL